MSLNEAMQKAKKMIAQTIERYMDGEEDEAINFQSDLECIDPKERLSIIERFSAYVMPKYQSVQMEANLEGKMTLANKLRALAEGKKVKKDEEEE